MTQQATTVELKVKMPSRLTLSKETLGQMAGDERRGERTPTHTCLSCHCTRAHTCGCGA